MTAAMTGTITSPISAHVIAWDVLVELADGSVLVRYRYTEPPPDEWYSRDIREGDGLRSLCRCAHMREADARDCRDASRRMADVHAERARVRTAALPAPAGARFLTCCAAYWCATIGGACPKCGALGAVLVPEVEVRDTIYGPATVITTNVHAYHALADAGFTGETAAVVSDERGCVYASRTRPMAFEIRERLAACGWRVKGRKPAQAALGGIL